MKYTNKQGFTMVELLVVLVIIGILAAVATPIFIGNTERARASEAVATMSQIRQAIREYQVSGKSLADVDKGKLDDPVSSGGLDIQLGVTQYFSNDSFEVQFDDSAALGAEDSDFTAHAEFKKPAAQSFVIIAKGSDSKDCDATGSTLTDCAVKGDEVSDFILKMDNTGRIKVTYKGGTPNEDY